MNSENIEPKKGKGLSKRAKLAIVGGVAAGAIALAGVAYKTVEQVRQGIENIAPGLGDGEVPTTFDPTETHGVIGPENKVILPQQEINDLAPTPFEKRIENGADNVVVIPMLPQSEKIKQEKAGAKIPDVKYEIREDKGIVEIGWFLDLSKSSDPNAVIEYDTDFAGLPSSTAEDLEESLKRQGFFNTINFRKVPKGTIIRAPLPGNLSYDDSKSFIDWRDSDGTIYSIWIFGSKGNNIFVQKPLLDAPQRMGKQDPTIPDNNEIEMGVPIAVITEDLDRLTIYLLPGIKAEPGKLPDYFNPVYVPSTLSFIVKDGKLADSASTVGLSDLGQNVSSAK